MADSAPNELALRGEKDRLQQGGRKGVQSLPDWSRLPGPRDDTSPVRRLTRNAQAPDPQLLNGDAPGAAWQSRSPPEFADFDLIEMRPAWVWTCGLDLRVTAVLYAQGVEDRDRFIGRTDYDWMAAGEAKPLMEFKRRVIDEAVPLRHQATVSWGGKPHKLDLIVTPNLDVHGVVESITCVCFDITAQPGPIDPAIGATTEEPVGAGTIDSAAGPGEADRIGGVVLVRSAHALRGPEGEIRLTKTEWLLLDCLLRWRGQLLQREDLLASVWGPGYEDEVSLLHDAVSRLRQRLRAAGVCHDFIRTVHGVGYCLEVRGSFITPNS